MRDGLASRKEGEAASCKSPSSEVCEDEGSGPLESPVLAAPDEEPVGPCDEDATSSTGWLRFSGGIAVRSA